MAEYVIEKAYYPAVFVARLINAIVGIIEIILLVRVLLELFDANAASVFVAWVYNWSGGLVGPFTNAFAPLGIANGSVLDVNAILAMIAYAILGWLIIQILSFIFVSTSRVVPAPPQSY